MAVLKNALDQITGTDAESLKKRERFELLQKAANSKIQEFRAEILDIYTDQRKQDFMIVGHRLTDEVYQSRISVKNDATFKNQMKGVVDNFFKGSKDGIKKGFQDILLGALDTFLVSIEVGEYNFSKFAVMTENNAIIRVDIRMWKQYFLKGGMFPESENILVFYTAKSIVDHTKLTIDELVYYMTEMAGPNATLKTVIDFVKEIKLLWGQLEEKPLTHVVDNYNSTDQPILV